MKIRSLWIKDYSGYHFFLKKHKSIEVYYANEVFLLGSGRGPKIISFGFLQ